MASKDLLVDARRTLSRKRKEALKYDLIAARKAGGYGNARNRNQRKKKPAKTTDGGVPAFGRRAGDVGAGDQAPSDPQKVSS